MCVCMDLLTVESNDTESQKFLFLDPRSMRMMEFRCFDYFSYSRIIPDEPRHHLPAKILAYPPRAVTTR